MNLDEKNVQLANDLNEQMKTANIIVIINQAMKVFILVIIDINAWNIVL